MTEARCSNCGAVGVALHGHHPTGRLAGQPFHDWTRLLCPACHRRLHEIWRRAGLSEPKPGSVLLLRRVALDLGQRREGVELPEVLVVAGVLHDLAVRLEVAP